MPPPCGQPDAIVLPGYSFLGVAKTVRAHDLVSPLEGVERTALPDDVGQVRERLQRVHQSAATVMAYVRRAPETGRVPR